MSDPGSASTENTGSPKKKISPARNVVGIIVLIAVVVAGWFQYSAVFGYNRAIKALEARSQDEEKGLLEVAELESLVGKSPNGPGSDFPENGRTFTKTQYTWKGPLKSYTLTAYYTKGPGPCMHHYEPDGATYVPESVLTAAPVAEAAGKSSTGKAKGKGGRPTTPGGAASKKKAAASEELSSPAPGDEPAKAPTTTDSPAPDKTAKPGPAALKPPDTPPPAPPGPPDR